MRDDPTDARGDDAPPGTAKQHGDDAAAPFGKSVDARAVTINRPVSEVFARFRDFPRLPEFMENVERIDDLGGGRSHWVVKAPAGQEVEWDARITEEVTDRLLAWESEDGASIRNAGRVEFRDAGPRGTVVVATIAYDPPGGIVGKLIAKLFQREPAIQARRDLRRLKQIMETGEIATAARTVAEREKELAA